MSLLLEDSCDLLPISLISALRKLALWLAERRQFFNADLLAKHDGRTLLYYFVEASNLSQAWQQECNCRFATTASVLKLFAGAIETVEVPVT